MFQTRFRELREAAGYKSQQSFADAFGVPQSTVGGWESGKRHPKRTTMIRLAQFFDVSVDDLLGTSDKELPMIDEEKEKPAPADGDRLAEKKRMAYERLAKLDSRNIEIAIGQLDVLLSLQEKQDKD